MAKKEEGKERRKEKKKRKIEITKNADCDETKTKTDDYVAWLCSGVPPYLSPLSSPCSHYYCIWHGRSRSDDHQLTHISSAR